MKQIECLSQTAAVETNKNPTSARLYQHPTVDNTVRYKSKSGLVFPSLIVIAMCIAGMVSCTADQKASAAEVEYLVKAGVKP